jgi:orotidine-5'-phosphate decarboxylase
MKTFKQLLIDRLDSCVAPLCVGLDSRYDRIPEELRAGCSVADAIFNFNKTIVDLSHNVVAAYKMNLAFYAGFGAQGLEGLRKTTRYIQERHPSIPLFADCKRSEMGESVEMVRREIFEDLGFHCVMVTPWFGFDTIRDYLVNPSHGVVVYVHDSNPSAFEIQDLLVVGRPSPEGRPNIAAEHLSEPMPLYEYVTRKVIQEWNTNGNVIIESGLTYPRALARVRAVAGDDMPILVAGLGAQGGKADDLHGLFGTRNRRLFVNVSRGVIFPSGEGAWEHRVKAALMNYVEMLQKAQKTARHPTQE